MIQNNNKYTKLKGQLERVTYENPENGYTVAKLKVYGYSELVTVVGNIPSPNPGEVLSMLGEWSHHPKFGEQFKVVFCSCSVPASVAGIQKYLGSGLIKGIGPIYAKRIVSVFGEKTLDVIETSVEKLLVVEGIGKQRVAMIAKAWSEQKEIREVMMFLQSHGISSAYATKIYKKYGNESIAFIRENPYRLAYDITGIGFVTADKIAQKLGFDATSPLRAEAGILFVLHELTTEGHVYYPYEDLLKKAQEMLQTEVSLLEQALRTLRVEDKIVIENMGALRGVYLSGYYLAEKKIAERVQQLRDAPRRIRLVQTEPALDYVQKKLSVTLAAKQIEAIQSAITQKILIITGAPGTGKTTIIKSILEIISKLTLKILLTAPTGRAAKRMSETTGYEAKTIHRLLDFNVMAGSFQKNEENPLDCDLIILDEASMVDTLLMHHLLKAIPSHAIFIIVGDINQLPSVGAGNVLKDMIQSEAVPVVQLNEIFRQAQQSHIIMNAHRIIQGQYPYVDNQEKTDFYFLQEEDPEKVLEIILKLVTERIPRKFGFNPLQDIQVLSPMNRGIVGTVPLNEALQKSLNPAGKEYLRGSRTY